MTAPYNSKHFPLLDERTCVCSKTIKSLAGRVLIITVLKILYVKFRKVIYV